MTSARFAHRIEAVSYAVDLVTCTCGWQGAAAGARAWVAHRRAVGAPIASGVILGPATGRKRRRGDARSFVAVGNL